MLGKNLQIAAAGNATGEVLGIEDVFSTYLYTGNGSTQTITNDIDLAGEGGLVWIKQRLDTNQHQLFDTTRGAGQRLSTDDAEPNRNEIVNGLTAFTNSGFSLGSAGRVNGINSTYVSWTFRKAPKFFDVVTYTGNGVAGRTIAHNLGSVPGCIIVKRTDAANYNWLVYHRSLGNSQYLILETTIAASSSSAFWNATTPTASVFTVGNTSSTNASGGTYVAYVFAHDAGGFGDSGNDNVVSCGSFSAPATVDLGWEPQFVIAKRTSTTGGWFILDTMRGYADNSDQSVLFANLSDAESGSNVGSVNSTGFNFGGTGTYIYIAIRRGPMKTPTDATEVFNTVIWDGNTTNSTGTRVLPGITSNLTDLFIGAERDATFNKSWFFDRLRGLPYLVSTLTSAESSAYSVNFDYSSGLRLNDFALNFTGRTYVGWNLRRAPGFFDMVAYTGTGSARTVSHNLGVAPELIIVKRRSNTSQWITYSKSISIENYLTLNSVGNEGSGVGTWPWNDTAPTSTVFNLGFDGGVDSAFQVNINSSNYIAYLFATCPGVSKVGSYTGTGTTLNIDCGFTNGARFVLIKRTDSTGDWFVWDTARGIISANDPYILLNSTAAEVTNTDYIDPLSSGFQISSTAPAAINASGGSFIFLAIA